MESQKLQIKDELENLREKYCELEQKYLSVQDEKEKIQQEMINLHQCPAKFDRSS